MLTGSVGDMGSSETTVTVGCELPREPNSGLLLEQVFLTSETSPCPSGAEGSACFCFLGVLLEESVGFLCEAYLLFQAGLQLLGPSLAMLERAVCCTLPTAGPQDAG